EFPLDIRFRVETTQPAFAVDGNISANLTANQSLNEFAMSGLKAVFDMSGEPFGDKSVTAEIGGSLVANLENETASLSDFTASLANLKLSTNLNVKGFGDKPAIDGRLEVSEFSLKQLLSDLGQPAIETEDPEVLKAIALSTNLGGEPGSVSLSDRELKLDDTRFDGGGSYTVATGVLVFDLNGDKVNAARFLPPPQVEGEAGSPQPAAEGSAQQTATANQPETDLLP